MEFVCFLLSSHSFVQDAAGCCEGFVVILLVNDRGGIPYRESKPKIWKRVGLNLKILMPMN